MRNRKRNFVREPGRRFKRRLLTLTAVLAALAACAPASEHWTPAESPKRPQVEWVEFHHRVAFAGGAHRIGDAESARLARFIRRIADAPAGGRRVTVRGIANDDARLGIRREAAVLAHLRDAGLLPTLAAAEHGTPDGVTVTVGRYVASAPKCPDWSKPAAGDPLNRPASNFGCADATNLVLMLADPGTLVHGRDAGPADGEALATGIEAYRKGEAMEPAPAITPLMIQSGVKGAGQ